MGGTIYVILDKFGKVSFTVQKEKHVCRYAKILYITSWGFVNFETKARREDFLKGG